MKLHRAFGIVTLATALALGASGCIVDIVFDPVGADASVEGAWLINGETPTAANCGALGISRVRVRFYDGSRTFDHPDLVFPCEQGSFDTSPRAVLADGVWTMEMLAIDASGAVIARGRQETFDTLVEGGHIVMTTMDFVADAVPTQVTASWTIDGATPDATNCAALGIATVGIEFMDGMAPATVACTAGAIAVEVLPGSFNVQVMAYDSGGTAVAMAMAESFTVNEGMTHALNGNLPIDFIGAGFNPRGSDAAIDAAWTIGKTAASTEACEVSGGTRIEFWFFDTTDTAREDGVMVAMAPCVDGTYTSSTNVLAAGTYLASMVYADAGGDEVGRADFNAVTINAGDTLDLTAADIRLNDTTISFALEWEEKTLGTYTDCATAGAASMEWELYLGAATTPTYTSTTTTDSCEDRLTFNNSFSQPVGVGTWELYAGGAGDQPKEWETAGVGACTLTVAEAGDLVIQDCTLEYTAP